MIRSPLRSNLVATSSAPIAAPTSSRAAKASFATSDVKTIILAGGPGTATFHLANCYPKLAFPMADGQPLVAHLLRGLATAGITNVAISVSGRNEDDGGIKSLVTKYGDPRLRVKTVVDDGLRGTAGAVKHLADFIGTSRFMVLNSNLWLNGVDLASIAAEHVAGGARATAVVEPVVPACPEVDYVSMGDDGSMKSVEVPQPRRVAVGQPMRLAGIYMFEPSVLDAIDDNAYADIREQLLGKLASSGEVRTHRLERPLRRMNNLTGYRDLNRSLLRDIVESNGHTAAEYIGGVCIGEGSVVSPGAYLLGPVMIGDRCVIEDGAQIIGPTVICDGTHVGPRVLVRESFVWRDCVLRARSRVTHSVITEACTIDEDEIVDNAAIVAHERFSNGFDLRDTADAHHAEALPIAPAGRPARGRHRRRRAMYRFGKRAIDIVASVVGLVSLLPVLLTVAVAIKLTSSGPVFFRQRRCGRDGHEFRMVKFRTMAVDAEARKVELAEKNEAAGPMFKIKDDPRVTRVGRWLRKTSLDELPQLWNVLCGEMSLVGPRPLELKEMSWAPKWRDLRLQVKPGVTGLWQVNGRDETGFEPWIEHDITYVREQSLMLDLRILAKTMTALVT